MHSHPRLIGAYPNHCSLLWYIGKCIAVLHSWEVHTHTGTPGLMRTAKVVRWSQTQMVSPPPELPPLQPLSLFSRRIPRSIAMNSEGLPYYFHSQKWSMSNFPCSLTSQCYITYLTLMKDDYTNSHYPLCISLQWLGECAIWTWKWKDIISNLCNSLEETIARCFLSTCWLCFAKIVATGALPRFFLSRDHTTTGKWLLVGLYSCLETLCLSTTLKLKRSF